MYNFIIALLCVFFAWTIWILSESLAIGIVFLFIEIWVVVITQMEIEK